MTKKCVLITGANGEMGHGLIHAIGRDSNICIVALDIKPIETDLSPYCHKSFQGNILDNDLIEQIGQEFNFETIYHLASILSTRAEFSPDLAHEVNITGTMNLLRLADFQSQELGQPVKFIYPSSIAVYGFQDIEEKYAAGKVRESEWLNPITMYGCNKLYCEHLGRYYSKHIRQIELEKHGVPKLDFRALRFPGLISAITIPSGGTSDFGPEMLHHAAQGKHYECFVRPDTRLAFMAMPDAIKALLEIEKAPQEALSISAYNVTSFSISAAQFQEIVSIHYPHAQISYKPHLIRQRIVDSWPADVDDSQARIDWSWEPDYPLSLAFDEYILPGIQAHYEKSISQ